MLLFFIHEAKCTLECSKTIILNSKIKNVSSNVYKNQPICYQIDSTNSFVYIHERNEANFKFLKDNEVQKPPENDHVLGYFYPNGGIFQISTEEDNKNFNFSAVSSEHSGYKTIFSNYMPYNSKNNPLHEWGPRVSFSYTFLGDFQDNIIRSYNITFDFKQFADTKINAINEFGNIDMEIKQTYQANFTENHIFRMDQVQGMNINHFVIEPLNIVEPSFPFYGALPPDFEGYVVNSSLLQSIETNKGRTPSVWEIVGYTALSVGILGIILGIIIYACVRRKGEYGAQKRQEFKEELVV